MKEGQDFIFYWTIRQHRRLWRARLKINQWIWRHYCEGGSNIFGCLKRPYKEIIPTWELEPTNCYKNSFPRQTQAIRRINQSPKVETGPRLVSELVTGHCQLNHSNIADRIVRVVICFVNVTLCSARRIISWKVKPNALNFTRNLKLFGLESIRIMYKKSKRSKYWETGNAFSTPNNL